MRQRNTSLQRARICQQGRTYGNAGTLGDKILDGLDGGADTGVISDLLAVEGDVEVAADEHLHEEQESQTWGETVCLAPKIFLVCPELSQKSHVTQL